MNCAEFIGILKSGQPIILRRSSKEYLRLAENSLSVVTGVGKHFTLWLASNRKFKRILRSSIYLTPGFHTESDFLELLPFLRRWEEMAKVRNWSDNANFPYIREIATFVYLTLIPEYWTIYLEVEGKPPEEALPLIEHGSLHTDNVGYDL